jgi:hypothetical protein
MPAGGANRTQAVLSVIRMGLRPPNFINTEAQRLGGGGDER